MKTRFFNAKILTMDGTPLFSGELVCDGDRIVAVGTESQAGPFDREVDCGGNLLLPGFKNAHTHSAMTFLRSHADDMPLQTWLYEYVFPRERLLRPGDCLPLHKLAILEYLTSGITAQFDMYMFRDEVAQAALDTGFRTVILNAANDFGGTAEEEFSEFQKYTVMGPLVGYQLGMHAEYTTNLKLMQSLSELVHTLKRPFFSHMNETEAEVAGCIERYGKRPFELLDSLGLFDYGGGGFHCVHLSQSELDIIQNRGIYAVTCPGSNMKLGSGVAPIQEFLQQKIPVAIGTDGPASNNCLDMFREMFLVTGLQKLRFGADAVDALEVLNMACCNGALAMGLPDCDCLQPGKLADLVLIDLDQPNMHPFNNIEKNLVYSGSKSNVKMTVVGGKILYERGEFYIGEDPERIYAAADQVIRRMEREA